MKKNDDSINKEGMVKINVDKETQMGRYCNVAAIHHTKNEFVFDFAFQLNNDGQLISRVITNPEHAKAILSVLESNIKQYETKYGKIKGSKSTKSSSTKVH